MPRSLLLSYSWVDKNRSQRSDLVARPSVPRGQVPENMSMRLTGVKRRVTSPGRLPVVRMAWETLGMNQILLQHGFERRRGAPATDTDLAFAVTTERLVQARSNVQLEKALQDPVLAACTGGRQADEIALSALRNDNRFDWTVS